VINWQLLSLETSAGSRDFCSSTWPGIRELQDAIPRIFAGKKGHGWIVCEASGIRGLWSPAI
jgi:hypothetical protein